MYIIRILNEVNDTIGMYSTPYEDNQPIVEEAIRLANIAIEQGNEEDIEVLLNNYLSLQDIHRVFFNEIIQIDLESNGI